MSDELTRLRRELIRTRQRVYALEAEASLARRQESPRVPMRFTSQSGEDLLAWDLLDPQSTGFFIEAGAFDGVRFSVTYPFEAFGWNGLLVEPHPLAMQRCVQSRPFSRVVHAALSSRSEGSALFTVRHDRYGGMLSHLGENPQRDQQLPNTPRETISVPVTSLDALLADHCGAIDLVVLDVEGAEADALAGFDLRRHRPRLMLIECGDGLRGEIEPCGYRFAGVYEGSAVYIRADAADTIERARWMTQ